MESYRVQMTRVGKIALAPGQGSVKPMATKGPHASPREQLEPLSRIIRDLNERFGTDFTDEDRVFIRTLEGKLTGDAALTASVRGNTAENARLTFDQVVGDRLQEMVETNFKFYKRVNDEPAFAKFFLDWLFDRFRKKLA